MRRPGSSLSILDHFSALSDPRERWRVVYPLPEILLLVLCATLCGMDDFVETKLWGEQRLGFLRRFLPYERGIPAHDTLNDLINGLDAGLFKACFASWVEALREKEAANAAQLHFKWMALTLQRSMGTPVKDLLPHVVAFTKELAAHEPNCPAPHNSVSTLPLPAL